MLSGGHLARPGLGSPITLTLACSSQALALHGHPVLAAARDGGGQVLSWDMNSWPDPRCRLPSSALGKRGVHTQPIVCLGSVPTAGLALALPAAVAPRTPQQPPPGLSKGEMAGGGAAGGRRPPLLRGEAEPWGPPSPHTRAAGNTGLLSAAWLGKRDRLPSAECRSSSESRGPSTQGGSLCP